jgi:molybdate transport system substrate-binding protein
MPKTFLLAFAFLTLTLSASAEEITVAAAADLQFALKDVSTRFEQQTGNKVDLIFGSSGNFFSQIQNSAPFDIFFSADLDYPKKLEAAGQAEPNTLYQYATGKIVLWVRNDSKLDLSKGLAVLLDPSINKISIANPAHAPYGRAAMAALDHEKLSEKLKDKFVLGENVSQAAQFIESGSADAGIIALSLAVAPAMKEKGRYVEIPAEFYPPLQQGCIVLASSKKKPTALALVEFMKKPEIVEVLKTFGLGK